MAKANTNEMLKNHHFWLLFALSVLFVGLAFLFLSSGVSASIAKKADDNKKQVEKVTAAKPPGKGVIEGLAEQKKVLEKRKDDLWKENWALQKGYFTWPKSSPSASRPDMFDPFNTLKFGTDINKSLDDEMIQDLQRVSVYQRQYELAAATIAPTAFGSAGKNPDAWKGVLRWVRDWGQQAPRSNQLWLLMEDLWVQRAMLAPIKATNDTVAAFHPVNPDPASPLKRQFRSRVWDLFVEVADVPGGKVFRARLANRTPQLQLLGTANRMVLNVRLDPNPGIPLVPLVIEGEFVPGNSEYPPKGKDGKEQWAEFPVEPGRTPVEIVAVEPVLDPKTVAVRRLVQLRLGHLSNKHAVLLGKESKTLEKPKFWPDDAAAPAAGGVGGPPAGMASEGGGGGVSSPPQPGGFDMQGSGGRGMLGAGDAAGGSGGTAFPGFGGGGGGGYSLVGAADANKNRYLVVTDQIRRMPVAFTVVCDQMYVQDVLIAYANSPLRFEAVQYHWRRLNTGSGSAGSDGGGFGEGGSAGMFPGMGMGMGGSIGSMGSGFGGSRGAMFGGPPGGSEMANEGGVPPPGGGSEFGGFGGGFGGLLNSVSEGQANAGLVELSVYGIISLYEPYVASDAAKEADAAKAADAAPMPMGDTPTPPMGDGKADAAKPDAAKPDATKGDAPKADAPKGDAPKGDAPKADGTKADPPKGDAPKSDPPKADAPKAPPGEPK